MPYSTAEWLGFTTTDDLFHKKAEEFKLPHTNKWCGDGNANGPDCSVQIY